MKRAVLILVLLGAMCAAAPANAKPSIVWDRTGGPVWAQRNGPAIGGVVGINQCLRDYCDREWDTIASISLTGMFIYRIMPNVAIFVDLHIGHLGASARLLDDDRGVVFGATGGGEFHLPIGGWLDPYAGFGMGYAFLGLHGEAEGPGDVEVRDRLHGLNFEMRFGADFFLLSRLPTFSVGPQFRIGFPVWLKNCWDRPGGHDCSEPEDMYDWEDDRRGDHDGVSPFLFHFGVAVKYGF